MKNMIRAKGAVLGIICLAAALAMQACGNKGGGNDEPALPAVTCSAAETGILVKWTAVAGALSYEVEYSTSDDMSGSVSAEATGTNTILEGTDDKSVYYIRVRARLEEGWGGWSETVSWSISYASIVVETYNILSETVVDKAPWPNRKAAWKENVLKESNFPDILALQEAASTNQRNEIIAMLKEHYNSYVSPNTAISPAVIFWKKDRFILVRTEVVDMLPGTAATSSKTSRFALHVRLRERATGKEVLVYSIHPPAGTNLTTEAKLKVHNDMLKTLAPYAQRVSGENGDIPVIIMGDMNCYPTTVSNGIPGSTMTLKGFGYKDTYEMTANRTNQDYRTYNSQEDVDNCTATYSANGATRIDYVFVWPEARFRVNAYEIVINFTDRASHKVQCPLPSDHNPVRVELEIK